MCSLILCPFLVPFSWIARCYSPLSIFLPSTAAINLAFFASLRVATNILFHHVSFLKLYPGHMGIERLLKGVIGFLVVFLITPFMIYSFQLNDRISDFKRRFLTVDDGIASRAECRRFHGWEFLLLESRVFYLPLTYFSLTSLTRVELPD